MPLFNRRLLPLFVLGLLLWLLYAALRPHSGDLPRSSALRRIPSFYAETVFDSQDRFSDATLRQQLTLVHIWGSWCRLCRDEQLLWLDLAKEWPYGLYAINYKDTRADARRWLESYGNPYQGVLFDPSGQIAQRWGVIGVPETYLIDTEGRIRYELHGPLDRRTFENIVLPLAEKIHQEGL